MGITNSKPEYRFGSINSIEVQEKLIYMNNINIVFNKDNINNNEIDYVLSSIDNDLIAKKSNYIKSCYETFINGQNQSILDQTHYILFDHYNMPLLKIINTSDNIDIESQRFFYAKFILKN